MYRLPVPYAIPSKFSGNFQLSGSNYCHFLSTSRVACYSRQNAVTFRTLGSLLFLEETPAAFLRGKEIHDEPKPIRFPTCD
ncbi:hypothetical protein HRbin36_01955 [bacterium HR36]|nr:hypothetical protein HRbin36_01955 [bacterium HR36]